MSLRSLRIRGNIVNIPIILRRQGYATAAIHAKAPVQLYGVDGTYATALYNAASKSTSLEKIEKSLNSLCNIIDKDVKLSLILNNPSLSIKERTVIADVLSKLLGKDELISNFLQVIAEKNRFNLIKDVSKKFSYLITTKRGEVEVVVTSATLLDSHSLKRLETAISKSKYVGPEKKLVMINKVNKNIIGGIIVEIGNYTIDLSVADKILKLNKILTDSI
ncbi:ATP synthase F1, delta subunit [Pneumocystis carinii B80]|uniref:ATP synthase subunit 5, mitochondrial n=1 Tax=Pneumocystis carinii (strain B80) TaxID=1408658 RepID=A0A0W4ZQD4_PNEC8|nr:ATP synthase F1, delta subunit [Pneumocystis carinii B80]KTW30588.1 ATP synthase F1, delta subunit [Pneumocystis carinii B80]